MAIVGMDINKAVDILTKGELVAIPTETVYGLAGNALDPDAVLKIFEVKKRPSFDPLIVHCSNVNQVNNYVSEMPEVAFKMAAAFWPGPLTLVLPKKSVIPDIVTSGLPTVGIRIPDHPLTSRLLQALDFPLAAPSANPFGYVSPTTAHHVEDQLGHSIKYILDGGACDIGIESTIIGFDGGKAIVYRLGGKPLEMIEEIAGKVNISRHTGLPATPGMLRSHYAPGKKMYLGKWEYFQNMLDKSETGLICFRNPVEDYPQDLQVVLSRSGNMKEAAKKLFAALRYFDSLDVRNIVAELLPEEGLGRAINDRLRRAAAEK